MSDYEPQEEIGEVQATGGCYCILGPEGTPIHSGDLLPDMITIGGPVSSPALEMQDTPQVGLGPEAILGDADPGWAVTDVEGNPVDPSEVLPSTITIGGPSSGYTVMQPDGTPISPGDVLPGQVVISAPNPVDPGTGGPANPVLAITDALVQSQQRLVAYEWEARHPGEPYPTDASGQPLSPTETLMRLTAEPGTTQEQIDRYNQHLERFQAVNSRIIGNM